MKKILIIFVIVSLLASVKYYFFDLKSWINIEKITTQSDIDNDWINDIDDILAWARAEVKNKTIYKSAYYSWGYPPENEWVCSDVIWRAFMEIWLNLKDLVDKDIKNNLSKYSRVEWNPDPNIDFRRVPNLEVFFSRFANNLITEIIPGDVENLKEWQAWDIVSFWQPNQHIAIISDKRDENWVPYLIHNYTNFPKEDVWVFYADKKDFPITWHFRWKY